LKGVDGADLESVFFEIVAQAPDLRQARYTSTIEDIRVWLDEEGKNPAEDDTGPKNSLKENSALGGMRRP